MSPKAKTAATEAAAPKVVKEHFDPAAPKAKAKAAKAKAGKAADNGRPLSQIGAAMRVMALVKKPISCDDLLTKMIEEGLWSPAEGKTPRATLSASITCDISGRRPVIEEGQPAFERVDRGLYQLTEAGKTRAKTLAK